MTLVPYFDGERTPNRPDATGTITGLRTPTHARADLARAAIEGVVCGLLDGLDALDRGRRRDRRRHRASSAAARGRRRTSGCVADLSGRAVVVPDAGEHVAAGACVQAAAVLHGRDVAARSRDAWELGARRRRSNRDAGVDRDAIRRRVRRAARG